MKKIYEVQFKILKGLETNTTFYVQAKNMVQAVRIGEKLSKTIVNFEDKPLKTKCVSCKFYAELDN